MQMDVAATNNSANQITTSQTLAAIDAQVQQNNIDLPVAIAANQNAGAAEQGFAAANGMSPILSSLLAQHDQSLITNSSKPALLKESVTSKASPVQTLAVANINGAGAAAAAVTSSSSSSAAATKATAAAAKGNGNAKGTGNGNAKANGNGNGNKQNNNKARAPGLSLKWASRLFSADTWEEPTN
jgi:hypothetical protein